MTPLRHSLWTCTLAAALLSSCGNMISEKSKAGLVTTPVTVILSPAELTAQCSAAGGQVEDSGRYCVVTTRLPGPSDQNGFSATFAADSTIQQVGNGQAVLALGSVTNNAVDLYLNGARLSGIPTASNRPVVIQQSGTLSYRIRAGGTAWNITAYLYTCYNQGMVRVYCPY